MCSLDNFCLFCLPVSRNVNQIFGEGSSNKELLIIEMEILLQEIRP